MTEGPPIANLYMTMLDRLGVKVDKFGDVTGLLPDIADRVLSDI